MGDLAGLGSYWNLGQWFFVSIINYEGSSISVLHKFLIKDLNLTKIYSEPFEFSVKNVTHIYLCHVVCFENYIKSVIALPPSPPPTGWSVSILQYIYFRYKTTGWRSINSRTIPKWIFLYNYNQPAPYSRSDPNAQYDNSSLLPLLSTYFYEHQRQSETLFHLQKLFLVDSQI